MIIKKSRIRNYQNYVSMLHEGEQFYVIAKILENSRDLLDYYGLYDDGIERIPLALGCSTTYNSYGKIIVDKSLPKVERIIRRPYHIMDWHGNYHDGICHDRRMCYQRVFIPPQEVYFSVSNGVVFSEKLCNDETHGEKITAAINVLLEIFGECEIWTENKVPAMPSNMRVLPWEILRSGSRMEEEWKEHVHKILESRPEYQKNMIVGRHEYLQAKKPDFCAVGTQNFWGYIVYGFTEDNLYIFESNKPNNATYIFRGNWEAASQLTKTEVLTGGLQEARVFHTENWKININKIVK